MKKFESGHTVTLTAIVGGHLPGEGEVTALIPGCGHSVRIRSRLPVEVGDTIEIDAEVIEVSDRTVTLECQGRMLRVDIDYLR